MDVILCGAVRQRHDGEEGTLRLYVGTSHLLTIGLRKNDGTRTFYVGTKVRSKGLVIKIKTLETGLQR
jgi:hypothetical protein